MATPLDLNIPDSTSTVNVSIIHPGSFIRAMPTTILLNKAIPGHEYINAPCYSFLIQHPTQDRTLIFDLGIRKDWENFPAPVYERVLNSGIIFTTPHDVREILDANGVDTSKIEAVIWSHAHLDHVGNTATFDRSTKVLVGPGTKEEFFPGYPTKPHACFSEDELDGFDVTEVDFSSSPLKIAGLAATDYFGDGSFYLLDAPGHCIGHICGLARVTSNPDSFILMGGDAYHHAGQLRPHPYHPLPSSIEPNPFNPTSSAPCLGEIFDSILPSGRAAPFTTPNPDPHSPHFDTATAIETIKQIQAVDAHDNILIVVAHDISFVNVAEFFPATANAFMEKGWVRKARWAWLADYAKAVGMDEEIPRRLFGDPRPVAERG